MPTAMQFLATAGELSVDGISLAPRLPAANTGRKSWFACYTVIVSLPSCQWYGVTLCVTSASHLMTNLLVGDVSTNWYQLGYLRVPSSRLH